MDLLAENKTNSPYSLTFNYKYITKERKQAYKKITLIPKDKEEMSKVLNKLSTSESMLKYLFKSFYLKDTVKLDSTFSKRGNLIWVRKFRGKPNFVFLNSGLLTDLKVNDIVGNIKNFEIIPKGKQEIFIRYNGVDTNGNRVKHRFHIDYFYEHELVKRNLFPLIKEKKRDELIKSLKESGNNPKVFKSLWKEMSESLGGGRSQRGLADDLLRFAIFKSLLK